MQRALHEQGLRLEIVARPDFGTNRPSRAIKHLGERGNFKAFTLLMSSRAVQEWFCGRSLPAISLGSVYDGISMPSIAHYVPPVRRIASGICRLVSEIADSGVARQQHIRIIPEFCKAESIAAVPDR